MAQEILPAPAGTEALKGEVVMPAELLKQHEQIIRRNLKRFIDVQDNVARSLNVIYHNDLWKLHKTAEGKRRYTNFNDYLKVEFGWEKTAARARQIMKEDLPLAITDGAVPSDVGDKRRTRVAPEITAEKAARVTVKQFETVREAFKTRMQNVEAGKGRDKLAGIHQFSDGALDNIINRLNKLIEAESAEAEVAPIAGDGKTPDAPKNGNGKGK